MPYLSQYNIFISHAWKYGSEYERLISFLDGANNFKYSNYSAPKDNPLTTLYGTTVKSKFEISCAIERKIRPVSVVLVISGMYANNREWMEYEIKTAKSMNKPIIAIMPWGNTVMPAYIRDNANEVVRWNTASIVSAIRDFSI